MNCERCNFPIVVNSDIDGWCEECAAQCDYEEDMNPHADGCYDEHGYFFDYGPVDSDPYD